MSTSEQRARLVLKVVEWALLAGAISGLIIHAPSWITLMCLGGSTTVGAFAKRFQHWQVVAVLGIIVIVLAALGR